MKRQWFLSVDQGGENKNKECRALKFTPKFRTIDEK